MLDQNSDGENDVFEVRVTREQARAILAAVANRFNFHNDRGMAALGSGALAGGSADERYAALFRETYQAFDSQIEWDRTTGIVYNPNPEKE